MAARLRVGQERPINLDAIAIREASVTRDDLAEDADGGSGRVDLRVPREDSRALKRVIDAGPFGQRHAQHRLVVAARIDDFDGQFATVRPHGGTSSARRTNMLCSAVATTEDDPR